MFVSRVERPRVKETARESRQKSPSAIVACESPAVVGERAAVGARAAAEQRADPHHAR